MKLKKRHVTILDVARHAGVSASTVSRALSGTITVAPDKYAMIIEAVNVLGYRPNKVAQGLVSGSSLVIGVLTQHIASPFYGELLTGIEYGLHETRYSPMIVPGNWRMGEEMHALDVFLDRRVDGIIILGGDIPDDHLRKVAEDLPLMVIGRNVPGMENNCLYVDNVYGAYSATKHLIELGHRNIAHVGGISAHKDSVDREAGYLQALTEAGITPDPRLIVEGDFREQSGVLGIEMLLTRGVAFTAIFVANDQMAEGVQFGLFRRHMRVPDDISIVGFDDQPGSAFRRPPLTTVRQPTFEMGVAASRAIYAMLTDEDYDSPSGFVPELIIRESTASIYPHRTTNNTRVKTSVSGS